MAIVLNFLMNMAHPLAYTASVTDTGSINDVVESDNVTTSHTDSKEPGLIEPITIVPRYGARLPASSRRADGSAVLYPTLKIGQGSFGDVYEVRVGKRPHNGAPLKMAVKVRRALDKGTMSQEAFKSREEMRMRYWRIECYCMNVLKKADDGPYAACQKYVIQAIAADPVANFILMPLYECNLRAEIRAWKEDPPYASQNELDRMTAFISSRIARGLQFVHHKQILHTDVRPENVFVRRVGGRSRPGYPDVVVGDFSSGVHRFDPNTPHTCRITAVYYRCPEAILGYTDYSWPIDVWGLGIIMWMLCRCNSNSPFKPINSDRLPAQADEENNTRQGVINAIHYYRRFDDKLYARHIPSVLRMTTDDDRSAEGYTWIVSRPPMGKMFGDSALKHIRRALVDLILACLDTDPDRRPELHTIVSTLSRM